MKKKLLSALQAELSAIEGCPELILDAEQIYVMSDQRSVAVLYPRFLTGKHKRFGALASFQPSGVALDSPIDQAFLKLATHIPDVGTLTHPYHEHGSVPTNFRQFASELEKHSALFRDGGVISIYERGDNSFNPPLQEIAQGLFTGLVAPMHRYANAAPEVSQAVIDNPEAYTHPLSTIYLVNRLNNIEQDSEEIISKHASKRLRDKRLLREIAALPEELYLPAP